MYVLVACEESQRVCKAFRDKGHFAFSCDILPCSGGYPEWHIQSDVLPLLNGFCSFNTMDGSMYSLSCKWDIILAFPPCTYLTVTQNWCYNRDRFGDFKVSLRESERSKAINFFLSIANADCDKICIENPVGCMSKFYKKPTQIIQPYFFGDSAKKRTCLWLKGLPCLVPTNIVDYGEVFEYRDKYGRVKRYSRFLYDALSESYELRRTLRSKTFLGIAKAMADQWG